VSDDAGPGTGEPASRGSGRAPVAGGRRRARTPAGRRGIGRPVLRLGRPRGGAGAGHARAIVSPGRRGVLIDLGLTAGVVAVMSIAVAVGTEPRARPVDAGAYLLAAPIALPILVRRRWPLGALLASAFLLFVYYASGYPGFSPAFALTVQAYFAALAGRWRWAAWIIAFYISVGYVVIIGLKDQPMLPTFGDSIPHLALMAVVILLGEYVRSRRQLAAETRERLRQAEESREREAARRVAEERLRIARELHDTVAHSMATITVQAGSALHLLGEGDDGSRTALTAIRRTGKAALAEMRATLGMLRYGEDEHGLDRMAELLDAVRSAGLVVEVVTSGDADLCRDVDHAAYRILQESLTNVLRHAGPAASARVLLAYGDADLLIEVTDDGDGRSGEGGGGNGLVGMRERAETVGGTFTAGPAPGGGFAVSARLPRAAA
jgi:signal transduction histidine kinase